jgi:hypothetical protein
MHGVPISIRSYQPSNSITPRSTVPGHCTTCQVLSEADMERLPGRFWQLDERNQIQDAASHDVDTRLHPDPWVLHRPGYYG